MQDISEGVKVAALVARDVYASSPLLAITAEALALLQLSCHRLEAHTEPLKGILLGSLGENVAQVLHETLKN